MSRFRASVVSLSMIKNFRRVYSLCQQQAARVQGSDGVASAQPAGRTSEAVAGYALAETWRGA
jgi:hypothetical protein